MVGKRKGCYWDFDGARRLRIKLVCYIRPINIVDSPIRIPIIKKFFFVLTSMSNYFLSTIGNNIYIRLIFATPLYRTFATPNSDICHPHLPVGTPLRNKKDSVKKNEHFPKLCQKGQFGNEKVCVTKNEHFLKQCQEGKLGPPNPS